MDHAVSTMPVPKFAMGQSVFRATHDEAVDKLPCPDCLDTNKWSVTTPAGKTYEVECQRCRGRTDLPSLQFVKYVPRVRRLTIGKIDISTHPYSGDSHVRYMCHETGIGSGSVYNEKDILATEDAAMEAAALECGAKNAKVQSTPEHSERVQLSSLELEVAFFKSARSAIWTCWYHLREFRGQIEEWLKDNPPKDGSDDEYFFDDLMKPTNYHVEHEPLQLLISAVNSAISKNSAEPLLSFVEKQKDLAGVLAIAAESTP